MIKNKFAEIIEDDLDFNFLSDAVRVESVEQFDDELTNHTHNKKIFYRGEKIQSFSRPLLPTIFRNRERFFEDGKKAVIVDSKALYDYYKANTNYFLLYENIIGAVTVDTMYPFLAFSQHYFGVSPLVDFSKSLDVAMSFALKDRNIFENDIVLYTIELKNEFDYTMSIDVANRWIRDYSVVAFNNTDTRMALDSISSFAEYKDIYSKLKGKSFFDLTSPSAKLIDVPMNDLMRYQQGVFLLLDDFSLFGNSYLTKKVRDDFDIKKWIISKDVCPLLTQRLLSEKPYYSYNCITDLNRVVSQIKNNEI